jgi:hypothetical protein
MACSTHREKSNRLLVGKLERKRPLGRPRRMWVDNVKMGERMEVVWSGLIRP